VPLFRIIDSRDLAGQEAFHRYIQRVFPGVSFRRWCELGGWSEDYRAFALFEGADIVANASVQRMSLVLEGRELTGWQLGAVGVVPERRGSGLQRDLLGRVLGMIPQQELVFLFANEEVLDFYPKFGFKPIQEHFFSANLEFQPAGQRLVPLDFERADHRELLARVAEEAIPVTLRFGARRYAPVLLWYWANFYRRQFYYSQDPETILIGKQEGDLLRLVDIVSASPVDVAALLPRLIEAPTRQIEFGFTPERVWPGAAVSSVSRESPLFVHEAVAMPAGPFKFPVLAQT
jgi:predicted N-acetyltransferase YhbS